MNDMMSDMNKRIDKGEFQPMEILMGRLEGQAYGGEDDGTCKPPEIKYLPQNDIEFRDT